MGARLTKDAPRMLVASLIGVLVLLVGFAALRAQSDARHLRAREEAQQALARVADNVADAIAGLRAELAAVAAEELPSGAILEPDAGLAYGAPHSLWRSDGYSVEFASSAR